MVLDVLKEQSEKAARKLSNVTLASSPNRASSQKDSFRKPSSPTSSRKTSPRPGAKKRVRVWSPGSQGKRKGIPKRPGGRTRQAARQRRAGRSLPLPLGSRWLLRGPEAPHRVEAAAAAAERDLRRAGSQGWSGGRQREPESGGRVVLSQSLASWTEAPHLLLRGDQSAPAWGTSIIMCTNL